MFLSQSFLYLGTTSLSFSLACLRTTYQSQDVVGAVSVLLWQDQSFEELFNNSSDDSLQRHLWMFFLGRGVKLWDWVIHEGWPRPLSPLVLVWLRTWSMGLDDHLLISVSKAFSLSKQPKVYAMGSTGLMFGNVGAWTCILWIISTTQPSSCCKNIWDQISEQEKPCRCSAWKVQSAEISKNKFWSKFFLKASTDNKC